MALKEFFLNPKKQTLFRSYWVHTIFQLLVLSFFYFQGNEEFTFVLIIFTNLWVLIPYLIFQFPLTGLLIVQAYDIMERMSEGQGIIFRIILSTGLFLIFASLIAFLLIFIIGMMVGANPSAGLAARLVMTYVTPVLLPAELLRQRIVMKKVYQ